MISIENKDLDNSLISPQFSLFESKNIQKSIDSELVNDLSNIDLDNISPKEALDKLYFLKKRLDE